MATNYHVTPNQNNTWNIKGEGNSQASSTHDNQQEAINKATEMAKDQKTNVIIHDNQGQIRDQKSFSDN